MVGRKHDDLIAKIESLKREHALFRRRIPDEPWKSDRDSPFQQRVFEVVDTQPYGRFRSRLSCDAPAGQDTNEKEHQSGVEPIGHVQSSVKGSQLAARLKQPARRVADE
jgi:hypothetical protein